MLKWTASAQKLNQLTPSIRTATTSIRTPHPLVEAKRRRRRATISNKENIRYTSTPMVERERNSPLLLSPLTDILNVTPKDMSPLMERTPGRIRVTSTSVAGRPLPNRRHSTVGLFLHPAPTYASTLPRFEEEYSPSTALPTGQQVALRGLVPDPFISNLRYFNTPELAKRKQKGDLEKLKAARKSLPRKLEADFAEIAKECGEEKLTKHIKNESHSAGMSDQTLDKLIDAILDSARKDEKKKVKPRKSFNLRRRTLLKNQAEQKVSELVLSPSYAAGEDPASDLSFMFVDQRPKHVMKTENATKSPLTPAPVTPPPGTPISTDILQKMPTPAPTSISTTDANSAHQHHYLRSSLSRERLDHTFQLETPARIPLQRKRQRRKTLAAPIGSTKRLKTGGINYFEVGLALPSIYV
ncbi:uncharacterized protein LOC125778486 [Bactrocera dorsalis]|uniref:Uncharacterized protein LOC125778486 n=1 Tax=Bactrocera dorsalis TaxID=27457 RepID=A0ABM3JTM7_BACDO|nr:uncharacterized protein LOC125778486 [Bactrocera dorsalis]